jgi:hypothetical protein
MSMIPGPANGVLDFMASLANGPRAPCHLSRADPARDHWRAAVIPDGLTNSFSAAAPIGGMVDHGKWISGFRRVTFKHTPPNTAHEPTVEAIAFYRVRAICLRRIGQTP